MTQTAYQDISDVDDYAATKLYTSAWDAADDETKTKATFEASRIIDSLAYSFQKLDPDQEHEFPRSNQTEVPQDVLWAHAEISIELLESGGQTLQTSTGVISERFAAVGITYDPNNVAVWLQAGVPSELAWAYLLKYLAVPGGIHLCRVS